MTTKIKTPGITDANVTTDKLNLISTSGTPGATIKGTSGQTDGYLQLNCEENTHGIKLKSPPHSAAQSYTLTFPQSITNGYFLKTDGSGNLSFAEVNVDDTAWQSSIVTAATLSAVVGYGYWIDTTSNACTITLPASANVGDQIIFVDYARKWATNNVTINQNGLKYQGGTLNPVYDTNGQTVNIVYSGATKGWIPISDDEVADAPVGFTATGGTKTVVGSYTIHTFTSSGTFTPAIAGSVDYLVVAGGGGSSRGSGSGGSGAGGFRTATGFSVAPTGLTVTIGAGGAGAGGAAQRGSNGGDSVFSSITSTGGGAGGTQNETTSANSGGSGGGANSTYGVAGAGDTPSTTPSQGNNGGAGNTTGDGSPTYVGAGGGGAGAVGGNGDGTTAGAGGNGVANSLTGSAVTRAGGGGGGTYGSAGGAGGSGGGGLGGRHGDSRAATSGTTNTGGGGGGAGHGNAPQAGAGGSGVVILSMPDASYSGTVSGSPTVATGVSGNTVLTFTGSGTYTG